VRGASVLCRELKPSSAVPVDLLTEIQDPQSLFRKDVEPRHGGSTGTLKHANGGLKACLTPLRPSRRNPSVLMSSRSPPHVGNLATESFTSTNRDQLILWDSSRMTPWLKKPLCKMYEPRRPNALASDLNAIQRLDGPLSSPCTSRCGVSTLRSCAAHWPIHGATKAKRRMANLSGSWRWRVEGGAEAALLRSLSATSAVKCWFP